MGKILLVDDNAEFVYMQGIILNAAGHEVVSAGNGREALREVSEMAFDLVITDLNMPEMDGLEMIMALRKAAPGLKIIAITGGARGNYSDSLDFADKFGAARTLTKPVRGSQLVEVVGAVLEAPG